MSNDTYSNAEGYNCETCGTFVPAFKKFGSGRFCSRSCANKFSNKFSLTEEALKKKSNTLKIVMPNKKHYKKHFSNNKNNLNTDYIIELQKKFTLNDIPKFLGISRHVFYYFVKKNNIQENPIYVSTHNYKTIKLCRYYLNKPFEKGSITLEEANQIRVECNKLLRNGVTARELCSKHFNTSYDDRNILRDTLGIEFLSVKDAAIQFYKKQGKYDNISAKEKYYKECRFTFPKELIPYLKGSSKFPNYASEKYSPYKNSITRDHRVSRLYGFEHGIDPYLISHPANCELMLNNDNITKSDKCSISVSQLIDEVEYWNEDIIHKIFNDFK